MRSFIHFFFFWLFPAPKIGERYVIAGKPSKFDKDEYHIVTNVKDGVVSHQFIFGENVGVVLDIPVTYFNSIYTKLKS